ncbi:MAG: M20/M25/M40 family metallo-hydrolase [Gemmatimonadaceae bacterium]|nr:M20/M25/M40 family metallo-hydrolase [Gemmatimonadaceae bacterium]MCC6431237.1 M20/M25/M40 family metallo-hydrolase [Gemmatimonadaceae bacterium]
MRIAVAVMTAVLLSGPMHAQSTDPTAALLSQLIRINTSNPPGMTQGIADLLAPRFRAAGFTVDVIPTPDSAKVHFIARLKGDGSKRPILLAAHADVVGVEREKWSVDPFAGVIKDGHVYGRGAIDFKGGLAVFAIAALRLAEQKVPLARDVIFLAEADEEGQPMNTSWLARSHWDKMDAEFSLNEGGWIIKGDDDRVRYVSISTADKTVMGVTLTATGTSTHSSMPLADNALTTIGRALARLGAFEPPVQLTEENKQFFLTLAKTSTGATSRYFRDLVNGTPAEVRVADSVVSQDPLLHAIMRNTIAPVMMNAGFRTNVIPGSAEATLNLRLIPGTDQAAMIKTIERVIDDPRVTVKIAGGARPAAAAPAAAAAAPAAAPATPVSSRPSATPSSVNTELYQALARESKAEWPSAEVTPYLFQAGTDAAAWRSRGIPVYGIYPYPISNDELRRMHGNDERVSVRSLTQGTNMIFRTLVAVAGKR